MQSLQLVTLSMFGAWGQSLLFHAPDNVAQKEWLKELQRSVQMLQEEEQGSGFGVASEDLVSVLQEEQKRFAFLRLPDHTLWPMFLKHSYL